MPRVLVSERSTPLVKGVPRIFGKSEIQSEFCISIPKTFINRQKYFAIEILPSEMIDDETTYKVASDSLPLMGFLMSSLFPIWVRGISHRQKFGRVSASKHYNTFPFPNFNNRQEKEIVEGVNNVNRARSSHSNSVDGKLLSDIYINNPLSENLEMAHEDLDEVVLKIFGLPKDASEEMIFERLFEEYTKLVDA